jgi:hypothetical protein
MSWLVVLQFQDTKDHLETDRTFYDRKNVEIFSQIRICFNDSAQQRNFFAQKLIFTTKKVLTAAFFPGNDI